MNFFFTIIGLCAALPVYPGQANLEQLIAQHLPQSAAQAGTASGPGRFATILQKAKNLVSTNKVGASPAVESKPGRISNFIQKAKSKLKIGTQEPTLQRSLPLRRNDAIVRHLSTPVKQETAFASELSEGQQAILRGMTTEDLGKMPKSVALGLLDLHDSINPAVVHPPSIVAADTAPRRMNLPNTMVEGQNGPLQRIQPIQRSRTERGFVENVGQAVAPSGQMNQQTWDAIASHDVGVKLRLSPIKAIVDKQHIG